MAEHIAARLHANHPKRMLALDGGGTRGIISLAFLAEIERILGERFKDRYYGGDAGKFRLAHYYDMIGGTSVGSMIAVQLAWGESVAEIIRRFETSAPKIFHRSIAGRLGSTVTLGVSDQLTRAFSNLFDSRSIRGAVWGVVRNEPLGSPKLKTGLTIITKRANSGSVWALNNNPGGRYYPVNHHYPLQDLVQASTAAPTYFSPTNIGVFAAGKNMIDSLFIDGGISPHNNPALKMLLMAAISGYNLGGAIDGADDYPKAWKLGAKNLLITSIGTGTFEHSITSLTNAAEAAGALQGVISDGQELALTLLQWMSSPRRPWIVDRMYGDLAKDNIGDTFGNSDGLLSFHRFDLKLEDKWLRDELKRSYSPRQLKNMQNFTNAAMIPTLRFLGEECAALQVQGSDFPSEFDGNLWIDGMRQQEAKVRATVGDRFVPAE